MKNFKYSLILLIGLSLTLTGCDLMNEANEALPTGDPKTGKPFAKNKKKTAAPPVVVQQAVDLKEYSRPTYPESVRRNPFQPDPEVVQPVAVKAEDRPKEPLEQFSLGELELAVIISEVAVPKAMFIDPQGFGHVLKEGDRLGSNGGVISDIRDNEVEVTEGTNEENGQSRLLTVKLRDVEIKSRADDSLSEEEREALRKLLESDEGRAALERSFRDATIGASTVDGEKKKDTNQTSKTTDSRFKGLRPPSP